MEPTFKNASGIASGWIRYLSGKTSELEKKRAQECLKCDQAVDGTYEKVMPDFSLKEVKGLKCNACGCPLSTLLRNRVKKCELNKW